MINDSYNSQARQWSLTILGKYLPMVTQFYAPPECTDDYAVRKIKW